MDRGDHSSCAEFLEATVGETHTRALWQYYIIDVNSSLPLRAKVVRMLNDMWACSAHYFAAHVVQHGGKIRYFQFQHEPSYLSSLLSWLGAFHGVELGELGSLILLLGGT
jgi:hypothetical protein